MSTCARPLLFPRALSLTPLRSDFVPLVNLVGVYFQIRDDYMNLQSDEVSAE